MVNFINSDYLQMSKLTIFIVSFGSLLLLVQADCEYDWEDNRWENCDEDIDISVGAIVGITIAALVLFIVIPTLICFCCAWACFSGRRTRGEVHTVGVMQPGPAPYPQQQVVVAAVSHPVPPQGTSVAVHMPMATQEGYGQINGPQPPHPPGYWQPEMPPPYQYQTNGPMQGQTQPTGPPPMGWNANSNT